MPLVHNKKPNVKGVAGVLNVDIEVNVKILLEKHRQEQRARKEQ